MWGLKGALSNDPLVYENRFLIEPSAYLPT